MTGRGRPKEEPPKRHNGQGSCIWVPARKRWRVRVSTAAGAKDRWFAGEDDARAHLASVLEGTAPDRIMSIAELVQLWYEKRSPKWSVARRGNVRRQIGSNIAGHPIGRVRTDRILVDDVEAWTQDMADRGLAQPSIRTYRSTLVEALAWGHKRKLVPHHPGGGEDPAGMRPAGLKTWLNLDEARRLIQFCAREHEPWGALFITCARLGLRPGEGLGIQRSALDFEAGTISVRAAVQRDGGTAKSLGTTKTGRTRLLAAPPQVMAALRRQCEIQEVARMVYADEWPEDWGDLLFLNAQSERTARAGMPPNEMTIRRHLTRICAEAGIPRVTPYELRHSCASIMLHEGKDPHKVADLLGTSVEMLRHHYKHLIDPVLRDGMDVWDTALDKTDS